MLIVGIGKDSFLVTNATFTLFKMYNYFVLKKFFNIHKLLSDLTSCFLGDIFFCVE